MKINSDSNDVTKNSSFKFNFSRAFSFLWPIKNEELKKFAVLTLLMFCILGIQNLVRALKDSVITTMIGSETIVFLKIWGVLPSAFLCTIIYVKLTNIMKNEHIFYLIVSGFLTFFAVFAFILFPNHEIIHFSKASSQDLILSIPNLKWFVLLLSNWSFSLFYIITELWPVMVFSLLYWQFVNSVTSVDQSRRFYPLFGLFGQTGLILSGQFLSNLPYFNEIIKKIFNLTGDYNAISIQSVTTIILIFGIIALITFWLLNHKVLEKETLKEFSLGGKLKKKASFSESIKMIINSKYICLIAILLMCYGMSINLVEGPWKAQVAKLYKNPTDYAMFVGKYLSYTGVFTVCFVLLGSNIVRLLGWFAAAIITPLMMLVTGMLFFISTNFDISGFISVVLTLSTDPLILAVSVGAIQNVLSKSSKYTLFDSTKEMAYVPLDNELKTKGKAAADLIGVKLGKSGSALIQSAIFLIFPTATYNSISLILMFVFLFVCIIWILCVLGLNKEYKLMCNEN